MNFELRTLNLPVMLLVAACSARGQAGITNESTYTVFRTGTGQPLLSQLLPVRAPEAVAIPTLTFEFGFATAEPDASSTFFDSFSLTLQSTNQTTTAVLLTADRAGVEWAPPTPNTFLLSAEAIDHDSVPFPNLLPSLPLRFAYFVTFVIPGPFAGASLNLFFDFFDNLNNSASLAYVSNLHVDAAGIARFYRLPSNLRTRIHSIRDEGASVVLNYHFLPQILELHSAATASGPYTRDTNFVLQTETQTLSLARPATNRFYRVFSDAPSRIVNVRLSGNQALLEFDFDPQFLVVESAFSLNSQFSDEPIVRAEPIRRALRVPKPGQSLPPL